MVIKANSVMLFGVDVIPVEVEVDLSPGLSDFSIVGMASKEIIESKKRIRSAIKNSGFKMPDGKITINLAPADLIKNTTGLDLSIAVGILTASGQINISLDNKIFWGELSLNGNLQNTKGVMAIALSPTLDTNKELYIPSINASEATIRGAGKAFPVKCLSEIAAPVAGIKGKINPVLYDINKQKLPYIQIINNEKLTRAIILSVAGRHNMLVIGPAGVGKSYVLKLAEKLLPQLSKEDFYEVNRVYGIAGLNKDRLINFPPFRTPHHTITQMSFIGGGTSFRVGEITLAHKGFLMLDELNLFNREILDTLREPLENKSLIIQRNGYSVNLPCDFTLLATMNPCPCGNYASKKSNCKCSNNERERFWKRVSRPILDRIDIQLFIGNSLLEGGKGSKYITLDKIKTYIDNTISFRATRGEYMGINNALENLANKAAKSYGFSIRAINKIKCLARTIADLEQSIDINEYHLSEAISYRSIC